MSIPISILDLAPIVAGSDSVTALRNTIELARDADDLGYHRYWLAEHHLTPGVASSAPAVLIGAVAAATTRIRVGAGAVQTGHQTALSIVEQFATLAALHPGRIDLGLGRSAQRAKEARTKLATVGAPARGEDRIVDGLLVPKPFPIGQLLRSPRLALTASLLRQPGAESPDYDDQVADILALLGDGITSDDGVEARAVPHVAPAHRPEVIVFGSSAGQSAQVAGQRGLRFAANYHVSPSTTLDAVDAYRRAFRPSDELAEPYVIVSADVVVADDDETARRHASPFALWVRSIRTGNGAIRFPTPAEAAWNEWTEDQWNLVADRVATQFVGTPDAVVERLETLRRVTGADEVVVTTIVHDHEARRESAALLAPAWKAV